MTENIHTFIAIHFADDTVLCQNHESLSELIELVNDNLPKVSSWIKANCLSLNIGKTKFVLFITRNKPIESDIKT